MTAVASASLTRVRVVVDHTMPTGTPLQRSTMLIFRTDILVSVFTSSRLYLLSKIFWVDVFLRIFYSHPYNDMFTLNGKSHWCNDTFTDVRFTSLLAKKVSKKNTYYLHAARISILLAIFSVIFIQIDYLF